MYHTSQDSGDEDSQNSEGSQNSAIVVRSTSGPRSRYPEPAMPRPTSTFDPESTVRSISEISKEQYVDGFTIGKGKYGKVYQCRNIMDRTTVAMKVVPKNSAIDKTQLLRRSNQQGNMDRRLNTNIAWATVRKEAALMRKCCHPNIVRFIELIDDPDDPSVYLVMENLGGGPIVWQDHRKRPLLNLPQIRRIMRDLALGLEYLHHEGIVHRDVKPQNIIWTTDRKSVKLIDFGIAHYFPPANDTSSSSRHGKGKQVEQAEQADAIDLSLFPESDLRKTVGTPAFLAPEVVWSDVSSIPAGGSQHASTRSPGNYGEGPSSPVRNAGANPRSVRPHITKSVDVWSFGVTLYCLLFGRLPFNPPDLENPHPKRSEFLLYEAIGTEDWDLEDRMGVERIPTYGISPDGNECLSAEGALVAQLLDQLLQKQPENRITMAEVKANPWILQDIANPEEWLRLTSPGPTSPTSPGPTKDGTKPSSNWVKSAGKKFMKLIPRKG